MARAEKVSYWRGKHATIPANRISGRLLYEEDTGDVFLEYNDFNIQTGTWSVVRQQLTDTRKFDINGGTFQGPVILYREPVGPMEPATKNYVDVVKDDLIRHKNDTVPHITSAERTSWNNKVDKVAGKGLSTNDYTTAEKNKLAGITVGATKTSFSATQTSGTPIGTISIDGINYTIYAPIQTEVSGNAGTATKLKTVRYLDGIGFNGTSDIHHYTQCNTIAGTVAKTATLEGFKLQEGSKVYVLFTNANTATNPTLNINGTGSCPITYQMNRTKEIKSGLYCFVVTGSAYTGFTYNYELVRAVDTKLEFPDASISSSGLMSAQDKQDFEDMKTKLAGIDSRANNYVLPTATSSRLGGVTVGSNITVASGKISVSRDNVVGALGYTPLSSSDIPSIPEIDTDVDIETIIDSIGSFQGASASRSGSVGLVPAPSQGQHNLILYGSGQWGVPPVASIMQGATSSRDGKAGMVPEPVMGDQAKFLRGDGTWQEINTNVMTGATASAAGKSGAVPAPPAGAQVKFLRGDATWQTIATMRGATASSAGTAGLAPAPSSGSQAKFLRGDATWQTIDIPDIESILNPISNAQIDEICV